MKIFYNLIMLLSPWENQDYPPRGIIWQSSQSGGGVTFKMSKFMYVLLFRGPTDLNSLQISWNKVLDTKKKTDEDVKDEIRSTYLYMTISKGLQTG